MAARSEVEHVRVSRQLGYLVAAAVFVGLYAVAGEFLDWDWPPFLTQDWDDVLDVLQIALVAGAAANIVWMLYDPAWLRHLGKAALEVLGVVVGVRMWDVFPFDFADGSIDWEPVTRGVIGIGIVVLFVAAVFNLARLVGGSRPPAARVRDGHVPAG